MTSKLPEIKCSRACADLLNMYYCVKGIDNKFSAYCEFKQLTESVDGVLPEQREFNVMFNNEHLSIEIYGKCLDNERCEYYLVNNKERYFIGSDINAIMLADTFDLAKIAF